MLILGEYLQELVKNGSISYNWWVGHLGDLSLPLVYVGGILTFSDGKLNTLKAKFSVLYFPPLMFSVMELLALVGNYEILKFVRTETFDWQDILCYWGLLPIVWMIIRKDFKWIPLVLYKSFFIEEKFSLKNGRLDVSYPITNSFNPFLMFLYSENTSSTSAQNLAEWFLTLRWQASWAITYLIYWVGRWIRCILSTISWSLEQLPRLDLSFLIVRVRCVLPTFWA